MKSWLISYSCFLSGIEEERTFELDSTNISEALMFAESYVQEQIDRDQIDNAVIWGVTIIDDNVWSE